jgi:pimeloyl-ACP methyl ester carboxylesterase
MDRFQAPPWLPGGHAQTIWPALFSRRFHGDAPPFVRERWNTPDGDFIDVDWLEAPARTDSTAPLLVLFHGLEGSSRSHYAHAFADWARARDWRFAVPHFRGCSGEINLAPRAYHSGDLRRRSAGCSPVARAATRHASSRWGSRWAAMPSCAGPRKPATPRREPPAPWRPCARHRPGGRRRGHRPRLQPSRLHAHVPAHDGAEGAHKLAQHPGLFDRERCSRPPRPVRLRQRLHRALHGFENTEDYWRRGSAKPHLHRIRIPALVLNARNDPFIPAACLPQAHEVATT